MNNPKVKSTFKKVLGLGQWLTPINQTLGRRPTGATYQDCLKRGQGKQTLYVHTRTHTHMQSTM